MLSLLKSSILLASFLTITGASAEWVRVGKQSSSRTDYYGEAVSMSSRLLVVGAPYSTPESSKQDAGAVHIYERKGDKLELVHELYGNKFDGLGASVAVARGTNQGGDNDEMLVVGAPRASPNGKTNAGLVKILYYNSRKGKWMQKGSDIVGKWEGEFFGESVAISDDGLVVIVGTGLGDDLKRGRVEVYKLDTVTNAWDIMGYPLEGHDEGAKFGTSVSIVQKNYDDDDNEKYFITIGAPDSIKAMGVVKVYNWDNDLGGWAQVGEDMEGDGKMDHFGKSVSMAYNLDSNQLLVAVGISSAAGYGGDPEKPDTSTDARVQVYRYNLKWGVGTDDTEWKEYGDEIEQMEDGDETGKSVELSSDGLMLAVGSPQYHDGAGVVRIFKFDGMNNYRSYGKYIRGKGEQALGASFSFSDNDLAIGSPYDNSVEIYKYDESKRKSGVMGKLFSTIFIIGVVGFVSMFAYKKMKNKGFKWSSFVAALPGVNAYRRGRSAVETEEHDEWPFGFFSASDRERIMQARRAEEGRADSIDGIVLHGMPRSVSNSDVSSEGSGSDSEDGSHDTNEDSTYDMRQMT